MTPAQFKARYVWAAGIADVTVQAYLTEAEQALGPASGWGDAWDRATGLYAANRMTVEGLNPTAQGVALAASGMTSVKSGTLSLTVASGASAQSTYWQELMALARRYRSVGPTVVVGCEGAGGMGASPYVKDAPFWSLPSGLGGQ